MAPRDIVPRLRFGEGSGRSSGLVKITDVARHAGVSPSTVSYVLSGKRSISEETARRVEESIRQLGYRPHDWHAGARESSDDPIGVRRSGRRRLGHTCWARSLGSVVELGDLLT